MFTKLSNENLMFALIPENAELHEEETITIDQMTYECHTRKIDITLDDLELMISKAREVGNKEKEGSLNNYEYLKSLGLTPLIKHQFSLEYQKVPKDYYIEKWIRINFSE